MSASTSNFSYGYPTPGPQHPSGDNVMDHAFFLDQANFKEARESEQFDYVVIGSGFCSLAFVDRLLALEGPEKNPKHPWHAEHPMHGHHPEKPSHPKKARVLVIESGPFFLPCHFQNLPHSFKQTLGNLATTFPWTVSYEMAKEGSPDQHQLRFSQGMVPFFGGRSTLWSAWCPQPGSHPELQEMHGWPEKLKTELREKGYYDSARYLLNVVPSDQLYAHYEPAPPVPIPVAGKHHEEAVVSHSRMAKAIPSNQSAVAPAINKVAVAGGKADSETQSSGYIQKRIFGFLQDEAFGRIKKHFPCIDYAPLAVASIYDNSVDFNKYSTPGPYLDLISKVRSQRAQSKFTSEEACLKVATNCSVTRIISDKTKDGRYVAKALETFTPGRRGVEGESDHKTIIPIDGAKLIIAAGVYPATTLIRNSFPHIQNAGDRATSHCVSSIIARFKIPADWSAKLNDLELGALYVPGTTSDGYHYHIQMTLLRDTDPEKHFEIALRHMPDVVATADLNQLMQSKDYIVIVCATLGEVNWKNKKNCFKKDPANPDIYTNSLLQSVLDDWDQTGWTEMDAASFKAISAVAGSEKVEYWVSKPNHGPEQASGEFKQFTPDVGGKDWKLFRAPGIFHECSTMHMGGAAADLKGDEKAVQGDSVVGLDYRPHGVENVYITGGGLLPTADAWNPTLTLCAMAQQLADEIRSK